MSEDIRNALKQQIIEQHGKLVYTFTTNEKEIQLLLKWKKRRQIISIILSALTASPAVIKVFSNHTWWLYLSALAGFILLSLSSYSLSSDSDIKLAKLIEATHSLWLVRERYSSLLIDFDILEIKKIQEIRDILTQETSEIYKKSPKTGKKAYKEAQKALQIEEEQTFQNGEAENLLPTSLRKKEEYTHD